MFDRKKLKEERKQKGLCVDCGQSARPSKTRCCGCAEKVKLSNNRRYVARKSNGACVHCGVGVKPELLLCEICQNDLSVRAKSRRQTRKQMDVCSECNEPVTNGKLCQLHSKKRQQLIKQSKKTRRIRRKNGLCERCGNLGINNISRKTVFCEICYLKATSKKHFDTETKWEDLRKLFENQKVCPYTGFELKIGVNASLDHKVPKCHDGGNELENLQFVFTSGDVDVTFMKGKMADSEFKDVIRIIHNHIWRES